MGTPVPPPIIPPDVPAGEPCMNCWGAGKTFGDISTPESIVVSISGVNKGPLWTSVDGPPVGGIFELRQILFTPCQFVYSESDAIVFVFWNPLSTILNASVTTFPISFASGAAPICSLELPNERIGAFENGSALIILPETE